MAFLRSGVSNGEVGLGGASQHAQWEKLVIRSYSLLHHTGPCPGSAAAILKWLTVLTLSLHYILAMDQIVHDSPPCMPIYM